MEDEHDRIADEALQDADRIQEDSDNLKQDIKETREDWKSKQGQESVPGAVDPDKFHPDEDEEKSPEPEYEQINPQTADASGGAAQESPDDDE